MVRLLFEGNYVYVEAGTGGFFDTARFQSPNMTQSGPGCGLSFWYHLYGTSAGSLSVQLTYKGSKSEIFEVAGNQGNVWKRAYVGLGALHSGMEVL